MDIIYFIINLLSIKNFIYTRLVLNITNKIMVLNINNKQTCGIGKIEFTMISSTIERWRRCIFYVERKGFYDLCRCFKIIGTYNECEFN